MAWIGKNRGMLWIALCLVVMFVAVIYMRQQPA